ncbi:MAG: hypothetical protein LBM64_06310 [Deltaproteobacteria bacterium]|jgi:lipopolysaccharide biosynthesis glycosyltransferase|nr:hypothetical protein [Deltaproteobacteria bacterium]
MDCILSLRDQSGGYYVNTYLTLLSLFKNASCQVNVHIMHDETIDHAVKPLTELAGSFAQQIFFHKVADLDAEIVSKISKRFNIAATYRLYALDHIEADRVVYLDSDIIVKKNLKVFEDINLDDYFIAAVKNIGGLWKNRKKEKQNQPTIDFLRLKRESYFNTGMVYLNLKNIRAAYPDGNIFVKRLKDAVLADIALPYPDQDIINSVCCSWPGKILWLDESFNYMTYKRGRAYDTMDQLEDKIIHYALLKPWDTFFPIHLAFWEYYAASPFKDDLFKRIDQALHSEKMEFMRHYADNPKNRALGAAVLKSGLRGVLFR